MMGERMGAAMMRYDEEPNPRHEDADNYDHGTDEQTTSSFELHLNPLPIAKRLPTEDHLQHFRVPKQTLGIVVRHKPCHPSPNDFDIFLRRVFGDGAFNISTHNGFQGDTLNANGLATDGGHDVHCFMVVERCSGTDQRVRRIEMLVAVSHDVGRCLS